MATKRKAYKQDPEYVESLKRLKESQDEKYYGVPKRKGRNLKKWRETDRQRHPVSTYKIEDLKEKGDIRETKT